ncbi:MAG: hypothetical protein HC897_01710 [Thermoanaerobaculia bacterium]|nr:hypothetical protein [Thermoanaerobaculia bacterium]
MKIKIITNTIHRSLGWVTDDDATASLVDALRGSGLEVAVHEVTSLDSLVQVLARTDRETLFWANAYEIPGGGSAPRMWLADVLEQAGVAHVGSSSATLRVLIDKAACQAKLGAAGVPIPRHAVIFRHELAHAEEVLEASGLALPVFIKPSSSAGSSGIYPDSVQTSYAGAARVCRRLGERFGGRVLVEEFLPGPELTVGILPQAGPLVLSTWVDIHGENPEASFLTEAHRRREFEQERTTLRRVESDELRGQLEELAERVSAALGIRDITRIDCRLDASGRPRVFDVNGMPGLSPIHSSSVQQAYACFPHVDRPELYRRLAASIVASAAERHGLGTATSLGLATLQDLAAIPVSTAS